jgi:energy-coupling factor transport system permease protein
LLAAAVGIYGVLDASTSALLGAPALILGLALSALGLWRGGRGSRRTTYRPDPWRAAEWLTLSCGVTAAVAMLLTARHSPEAIGMPLEPLAWPELPMAAAAGLLVGALPAWLTPQPPRPVRRGILTRAGRVSAGV